jgi:Mg-chelatase subunit ChlD
MGLLFGSSSPSKMAQVKENSKEFVDTLHVQGTHYGAVSHFDSSYTVGQPRSDPGRVKRDISGLSTGGKTALYDSIVTSMVTLQKAQVDGDRTAMPALLLTLTDGKENRSDASLDDVREAIAELGFVPQNRCYFAIAGIGDASQRELRRICEDGLGIYTHTDSDMEKAFKLFVAATVAVVRGRQSYRGIRKNEQQMSITQLEREFQAIGAMPMEYMLNVDTSGSMSNAP